LENEDEESLKSALEKTLAAMAAAASAQEGFVP